MGQRAATARSESVPHPDARGVFSSGGVRRRLTLAKLQGRRPEHSVELACTGPKAVMLRATRRQSAPRPARRRQAAPGGQHKRRTDEEAHRSEKRSSVGQRNVDQGIGARQHEARERRNGDRSAPGHGANGSGRIPDRRTLSCADRMGYASDRIPSGHRTGLYKPESRAKKAATGPTGRFLRSRTIIWEPTLSRALVALHLGV